ncbi:glucosyltransferase [Xylographa opegraphella]|nr:glucosyltransferase [Xylographa opegraphella]
MNKDAGFLPLTSNVLLSSGLLLIVACYWFFEVNKAVPEPYLDEVFHVRQALVYWANDWATWDSKITTPAGLYITSYAWLWILKAVRVSSSLVTQLRSLNLLQGTIALYFASRQLLFDIPRFEDSSDDDVPRTTLARSTSPIGIDHATLNICLFPPLFFFYSLFYTDVTSTVLVLLAYMDFHLEKGRNQYFLSIAALLLRQTNIFWVAIYLGGLEVLRNLPKGRSGIEFPCKSSSLDVMTGSWQHASLYDPLVEDAWFEDYIKAGASLSIASLANMRRLAGPSVPYLSLLLGFGGFVFWNGGVVLGDKENHIASIHLAQMLYIWPYIAFFSFPLLLPYILNAIFPKTAIPSPLRIGSTRYKVPRPGITLLSLGAMLIIVRYNTIVHSFTLADNRHYPFYVFRLLLRHPAIKYLVTPIYYVCAWAAVASMSGLSGDKKKIAIQSKRDKDGSLFLLPSSETSLEPGTRVSFVLIWLLATSLSLVTAPLVEPRYFIIPWLMWRLHVPPSTPLAPAVSVRPSSSSTASKHGEQRNKVGAKEENTTHWLYNITERSFANSDYTLVLETLWFLSVNWVVGYVFLHWEFEWVQEKGSVQRFMW